MNGSYMLEQLERFSYFQALLEKKELEEILDQHKGVVSRAYIIEFAKKAHRREGSVYIRHP